MLALTLYRGAKGGRPWVPMCECGLLASDSFLLELLEKPTCSLQIWKKIEECKGPIHPGIQSDPLDMLLRNL